VVAVAPACNRRVRLGQVGEIPEACYARDTRREHNPRWSWWGMIRRGPPRQAMCTRLQHGLFTSLRRAAQRADQDAWPDLELETHPAREHLCEAMRALNSASATEDSRLHP